jgi:hypothetical protein
MLLSVAAAKSTEHPMAAATLIAGGRLHDGETAQVLILHFHGRQKEMRIGIDIHPVRRTRHPADETVR